MRLRNRKGQGAVEYALIALAIISIVVAVVMTNGTLRNSIKGLFNNLSNQINTPPAS